MKTLACDPAELRTLFLFEKLTDEQLDTLCELGHVELIEPGWVFREGDPATCFYVLMEGTLALSRQVGADNVESVRTDQKGVYAGAWQSYLGDKVPQAYLNSMRVTTPARFFVLDAEKFAAVMREWFPMAVHLLEGLFFGIQKGQQVTQQRERLQALASLSAGLTHELNNPAAAAVRATSALRVRVAGMRHKLGFIATGKHDAGSIEAMIQLQEEAAEQVTKAPTLTPMEAADREDQVGDWLDQHGISGEWEIAPTFVQAGLDESFLDRTAATVGAAGLEGAIRWLNYTVETELLMNEISDATRRISALVGAAKQYSQMDRAPFQVIDVHDLLKSTLTMMSGRIGPNITVVKDFDRSIPPLPGYPAELNQVWTNLIDNAVGAMEGEGTLTVRTAKDGDQALIEIGDTGPGVPDDIKARIFEPFFTTKDVGEGTGLGLDISWRIVVSKHHGDLRVESRPGDTRFQVRLPMEPPEPLDAIEGTGDGAVEQ